MWKQSVRDIEGEVLCGKYGLHVFCLRSRVSGSSLSFVTLPHSCLYMFGFAQIVAIADRVVSQFTLFANFKGAKPDFHQSMVCISDVL
jgi:hypothetical protein